MSSRLGFSLERMACVRIDNTSLHIHVGMAVGAGGAKLLSYGFPVVVIL